MEILLVDDEPANLELLGQALRARGHRVSAVADGAQAIEVIASQSFDAVVCDVRMPGIGGLEVLRHVRERSRATDVILMTAHGAVRDAVQALREGAIDYLVKPVGIDELVHRLDRGGRESKSSNGLGKPTSSRDPSQAELVGGSAAIHRVNLLVDKFALSDAPVLITGESGTGKGVVAGALHHKSRRSAGRFVAVNCASLPESLLEAELFGHERGAFTGAIRKRDGRFKAADGGSLLLDEVAEMPLSAQAKLLRVLEEHTFEPLGTNESVNVDVRILSATHRPLKDMVAQGRFREDLYYRLKILEIELPPLRERRDDLPALVESFLRRFSDQPWPRGITAAARAAIAGYSFPGNVRELEHAIRHAMAVSDRGEDLDVKHLPADLCHGSVPSEAPSPLAIRPLAEALAEFEREYLRRAVQFAGGSKTRTAQLLGISRKSLWEKQRRYALVAPDADDELTGEHLIPPASKAGQD